MAQWSAAALLLFYVCRGSLGVDLFEWSQSVQLPVDLWPQGNFSSVRWTRGLEEVHQKTQEGDDLRSQSPRFKGRTQMKPDALQTGDLTLVLTNPTSDDVGRYTCVARLGRTDLPPVTVDLRFKGERKSVEVKTTVSLPFKMGTLRSGVRVRWTREPEEPEGSQGSQGSQEVHLRVGDRDDLRAQSSHFKGRTQMKPDALKTGDLTLVLINAGDSDTGTYTCSVTENNIELGRTTVKLINKWLSETEIIGFIIISVIITVLIIIVSNVLIFFSARVYKRKKKTKGPSKTKRGIISIIGVIIIIFIILLIMLFGRIVLEWIRLKLIEGFSETEINIGISIVVLFFIIIIILLIVLCVLAYKRMNQTEESFPQALKAVFTCRHHTVQQEES